MLLRYDTGLLYVAFHLAVIYVTPNGIEDARRTDMKLKLMLPTGPWVINHIKSFRAHCLLTNGIYGNVVRRPNNCLLFADCFTA